MKNTSVKKEARYFRKDDGVYDCEILDERQQEIPRWFSVNEITDEYLIAYTDTYTDYFGGCINTEIITRVKWVPKVLVKKNND